jgi:hypothetical protein
VATIHRLVFCCFQTGGKKESKMERKTNKIKLLYLTQQQKSIKAFM